MQGGPEKLSIIVHGGAWSIPEAHLEDSVSGMKAAARAGYEVLKQGGSAVEAVETAVVSMEDNPIYSAGRGSSLNADGKIEMDALIMDGTTLRSGAVAAVKNIKNPVKLARMIMNQTEHTLVVGEGANKLAESFHIPTVPSDQLVVDHVKAELENFRLFSKTRDILYKGGGESVENYANDHDTVGACALDGNGNLACALSTGGLTAKLPGRVGDTPLLGSGGYADDICAVASTGHGESIAKSVLAYRIATLREQGMTMQEATDAGLQYMKRRLSRYGGAVSVDRDGNFGMSFTTEKMPWATISSDGVMMNYGIAPGENFSEEI